MRHHTAACGTVEAGAHLELHALCRQQSGLGRLSPRGRGGSAAGLHARRLRRARLAARPGGGRRRRPAGGHPQARRPAPQEIADPAHACHSISRRQKKSELSRSARNTSETHKLKSRPSPACRGRLWHTMLHQCTPPSRSCDFLQSFSMSFANQSGIPSSLRAPIICGGVYEGQ